MALDILGSSKRRLPPRHVRPPQESSLKKRKKLINLYLWLPRASVTLHGLSPAVASRGRPFAQRGGFSCCGAQAPGPRPSAGAMLGLGSCDARASLLPGVWNLPRPGTEPESPRWQAGSYPLHHQEVPKGPLLSVILQSAFKNFKLSSEFAIIPATSGMLPLYPNQIFQVVLKRKPLSLYGSLCITVEPCCLSIVFVIVCICCNRVLRFIFYLIIASV